MTSLKSFFAFLGIFFYSFDYTIKNDRKDDDCMKAWEEVQMMGIIDDLKEQNYRTILLVSALAELLIEKRVVSREEIADMGSRLERADISEGSIASEGHTSN